MTPTQKRRESFRLLPDSKKKKGRKFRRDGATFKTSFFFFNSRSVRYIIIRSPLKVFLGALVGKTVPTFSWLTSFFAENPRLGPFSSSSPWQSRVCLDGLGVPRSLARLPASSLSRTRDARVKVGFCFLRWVHAGSTIAIATTGRILLSKTQKWQICCVTEPSKMLYGALVESNWCLLYEIWKKFQVKISFWRIYFKDYLIYLLFFCAVLFYFSGDWKVQVFLFCF